VPSITFGHNVHSIDASYILPEQTAIAFYHSFVHAPLNPVFDTSTVPLSALSQIIVLVNELLTAQDLNLDADNRTVIQSKIETITPKQLKKYVRKRCLQTTFPPLEDPELAQLLKEFETVVKEISWGQEVGPRFTKALNEPGIHEWKGRFYDTRDPHQRSAWAREQQGVLEETAELKKKKRALCAEIDSRESVLGCRGWRQQIDREKQARELHHQVLAETITMLDSVNVVVVSSLLQMPHPHSYNF